MLIKQLRIRNFRCIRDQRLDCSEITALIGSNGGGKSTVLKSLEAFYDGPSRLPSDDFHARQLDSDVEISVTYGALTDGEKDLFQPYLKDDTLTVTRIFTSDPSRPSGKYRASRLQNPDFVAVFRANTAAEKRAAYKQIRDERYPELPAWANQAAAIDALATWESNHPDRCAWLPDDGQFFGFSGVGRVSPN